MHLFGSTENGVYGAGLYAFGAANALRFTNEGDSGHFFCFAMFCIQGYWFDIQKRCQSIYARLTAWRAFVDGFTVGDRLRIGSTARIASLATLGLGQNIVDLVCNGIALRLELFGSKTQQRAEYHSQPHQGEQGAKQRIL